jgi:hypothetical protein
MEAFALQAWVRASTCSPQRDQEDPSSDSRYEERTMPTKRPNEPIAPTTIPGQPLDPRIPPDQRADDDQDLESQDDDDVGTDERGNEMLSARLSPTAPDVRSDRAVDRKENSPLEIQEIENLEDDAKGG